MATDTTQPSPRTIRFQQTAEGSPLKGKMRSELGLEAYVDPVNPPSPSPQVLSHRNSAGDTGAEAKQEQCSPAPPAPTPIWGPTNVLDIPWHCSSGRTAYDAQDVRWRLRELAPGGGGPVLLLPPVLQIQHCRGDGQGLGAPFSARMVTGRIKRREEVVCGGVGGARAHTYPEAQVTKGMISLATRPREPLWTLINLLASPGPVLSPFPGSSWFQDSHWHLPCFLSAQRSPPYPTPDPQAVLY